MGPRHIDEDERPLGTTEECARLGRFLGELRERGRRPKTIDAYQADWQALARWVG